MLELIFDNIKIIEGAIFGALVMGLYVVDCEGFDFKSLTTTMGRQYHEIEILGADEDGLLFRHRDGIAKESFSLLSAGVREMYQPIADVPSPTSETTTETGKESFQPGDRAPELEGVALEELVLTVWVRHTFPSCPPTCQLHPNPRTWPVHWHRFHPAHYLTNPVCRARVVENFLRFNGLY